MNRLIDWCLKPKVVLLIFKSYPELYRWLKINEQDIIDKGAIISKTTNKITFLNGITLYLGYAEKDEDYDKFLSFEYDIVIGGNEELKRRAMVNKL